MPSAPKPNTQPTSGNEILLIEEYDALAAAIGSALKKFAPGRVVHVASNFNEAEELAARSQPSLLIIDFDPPNAGLTDFLYRMREVCPDACALVIGARVQQEVAEEFRSLGALHFVAKPFEIQDFGAAVQALTAETGSVRLPLSSLGVADVALAQCAGGRSVALAVKATNGKSGEIHIVAGQIVHAVAGKRHDADALAEMFSWSEPTVREQENQRADDRTIIEEWAEVFLDAVRLAANDRPAVVAVEPPKPQAKTGKKIVVIDDTDMLLVFVEDALLFADSNLQIATAPTGTSGVERVTEVLPDLVLLDYSLPDINGDEVCRRLLADKRTAHIPILMMSGHVLEMTVTAETYENVVASIPKPFRSEALVSLVEQTLKGETRRPAAKIKQVPKPPAEQSVEPVQPEKVPTSSVPPALGPPASPKPIVASPPIAEPPPLPEPIVTPPPIARPPPEHPPIAMPLAPQFERSAPPRQSVPPTASLRSSALSAPARVKEANEVVLGLSLQVVSMQLTPSLRMGAIRAKPSSFTVSLHVSPAAVRAAFPAETVFELGRIDLDTTGRISTVRLVPTLKAFQRLPTRNDLQIGALDVVPHDSSEHVQLTPSQNAPMMMHLLAHLEIAGVELSTNFQVAELICKNRSNTVRVTLNSDAVGQEQTGVFCETAAIRLDNTARLAELLLKPLK